MINLKNTNILEWLETQKSCIKAHRGDIDLDIEILKETNLEENPIIYGCVRELGSDILNRQRVFYNWSDTLYYYKLENFCNKEGEIYGDITLYEVTDNTIKELKKGIN